MMRAHWVYIGAWILHCVFIMPVCLIIGMIETCAAWWLDRPDWANEYAKDQWRREGGEKVRGIR